jgi:hypothetical protein
MCPNYVGVPGSTPTADADGACDPAAGAAFRLVAVVELGGKRELLVLTGGSLRSRRFHRRCGFAQALRSRLDLWVGETAQPSLVSRTRNHGKAGRSGCRFPAHALLGWFAPVPYPMCRAVEAK